MIGPFGHLGADACAFADGSMDEARAAWAEAHLDRCEDCAAAVREQRRQRRVTSSLGDVEVPSSLQDRLLALCEGTVSQDDDDDARRPLRGELASAPWAGGAASRTRRATVRVVAVAAVSVLGVGVAASGSLMAIGATRTTSPERLTALAAVAPTASTARVARVSTEPEADEDWPAGWTSPDALPDGFRVSAVHDLDSGDLRVDLVVDGHDVTVLEAEGVLGLTDVTVTRSVRIGELEAHLVGDWWVAQAGTEIVAVMAADDDVSLAVIGEFDTSGSTGVLDSITRGWQVIAGG